MFATPHLRHYPRVGAASILPDGLTCNTCRTDTYLSYEGLHPCFLQR
jgi:hypothetical protein